MALANRSRLYLRTAALPGSFLSEWKNSIYMKEKGMLYYATEILVLFMEEFSERKISYDKVAVAE